MDAPPARTPETTPAAASTPSTPAPASPGDGPIDHFRWGIEDWAARMVVSRATGKAPDDNAPEVEWIERELREYAAELAGPNPTPIERTLSETAALAWFAVRYVEAIVFTAGDRTLKQADYDIRRLDAAHRRYLATLRTLAQVRKLALPGVVQVNVGRQVNAVANAGSAI